MIKHGLKALQGSLNDGELTSANSAIAIVGKDMSFTVLEDASIEPYIAALKDEDQAMAAEVPAEQAPAQEQPAEAAPQEAEGPAPMES